MAKKDQKRDPGKLKVKIVAKGPQAARVINKLAAPRDSAAVNPSAKFGW